MSNISLSVSILLVHSSICEYLTYLCFLTPVNNDSVNTGVQVMLKTLLSSLLGNMPRSGIVELYDHSLFGL